MKPIIEATCVVLLITLSYIDVRAEDYLHLFTSKKGQEIRASIVSASESSVKIKRQDGQIFTTDISLYSAQDQEYIRKWVQDNAFTRAKFKVMSTTVTGKKILKKSGIDNHIQSTTYNAHFKVNIINESLSENFENIELRYVIYKQPGSINVKSKDKPGLVSEKGIIMIKKIPAKRSYTFETGSFPMSEIKYNNYKIIRSDEIIHVTFKGSDQTRDRLDGIWLKMYVDGRLLWEDTSHTSLLKNKWPF